MGVSIATLTGKNSLLYVHRGGRYRSAGSYAPVYSRASGTINANDNDVGFRAVMY